MRTGSGGGAHYTAVARTRCAPAPPRCAPATGYATRARSRCSCSVSAQAFRLDHSSRGITQPWLRHGLVGLVEAVADLTDDSDIQPP